MNRVEKFFTMCNKHKVISLLIIIGVVIVAIGNFADAVAKITALFKKNESAAPLTEKVDSSPLKERIRSYLRTVNPKIVELLDDGQTSVAVMINTANQPALFELQKDPDFGSYLEVKSTGSVSAGAHNTISGHLNDLQDVGMLSGFQFVFRNRLKLQ